MAERQYQSSSILTSNTEIYNKASGIFDVIISHANSGCDHCLNLIKNGIGNQPIPDADDTTIPEPTRNDQR